MTDRRSFAISPHAFLREVFIYFPPSQTKGAGNAGRLMRPQPRMQFE